MVNYQYQVNNFVGIAPDVASQYHRANTRRMAHVRPSLKRIKKETEKLIKIKLKGFSFIREHDRISHSAKVSDEKNRRYYICLMLGPNLYLEEFDPFDPSNESIYIIAGLKHSTVTVSAARLREIFQCIPAEAYELRDSRCRISKDDFMSGADLYAAIRRRQGS